MEGSIASRTAQTLRNPEKIRLRDRCRVNKKARTDSASRFSSGITNVVENNLTASKPSDDVLFEASFLEGTITSKLMADHDADSNLLQSEVLHRIKTEAPTTRVTTLKPSLLYSEITSD